MKPGEDLTHILARVKGINPSSLPSCKTDLMNKIKRANFVAIIQKKCSTEKTARLETRRPRIKRKILSSSTGLKVTKSLKVWKTFCWMKIPIIPRKLQKSMQILTRMMELKPHQMNTRRKNSGSVLIGSDLSICIISGTAWYVDVVS